MGRANLQRDGDGIECAGARRLLRDNLGLNLIPRRQRKVKEEGSKKSGCRAATAEMALPEPAPDASRDMSVHHGEGAYMRIFPARTGRENVL